MGEGDRPDGDTEGLPPQQPSSSSTPSLALAASRVTLLTLEDAQGLKKGQNLPSTAMSLPEDIQRARNGKARRNLELTLEMTSSDGCVSWQELWGPWLLVREYCGAGLLP